MTLRELIRALENIDDDLNDKPIIIKTTTYLMEDCKLEVRALLQSVDENIEHDTGYLVLRAE